MNKNSISSDIIINEDVLAELDKLNSGDYGIIYGHYCTISKKWYCGQTIRKNPYERWGLNGSNYKGKFRNAINKYGWDAFEHHILGVYPSEQLSDMEKLWINLKDSYMHGYNATEGGSLMNMTGKHHSDESKYKIGVSNGRRIVRFKKQSSQDDTYIYDKEYLSAADAARDIGVYGNGQIISCCKGYRPTIKGFVWKYADDVTKDTIIHLKHKSTTSYGMLNKKHTLESKNKIRESNILKKGKAIYKCSLDGNILDEYDSISSACRLNNYSSHSGISRALNNANRTAYGYKWRYKE